jgi:hypothetical protein
MSVNQPDELSLNTEREREFAQELARSLRRVDAPVGFADRTLGRIHSPVRPKVVEMRRAWRWAGGAIAASVLLGAVFAEEIQLRHRKERTELAQQQFEAGLRITDRTLEHARQQLQQAGIQIGN